MARAHASRVDGLRLESDSMPSLNAHTLFTQQQMGTWSPDRRFSRPIGLVSFVAERPFTVGRLCGFWAGFRILSFL